MDNDSESGSLFIQKEDENQRLDQVLALRFPEYSRSYFQGLIKGGLVLVNGVQQKKRYLVQCADEIEIEFALTDEIQLEPENIALDILFEDETLLAINKPPGLVVHPAPGNRRGTFVNALLYHCKNLSYTHTLRPGIVHRLDKETSGVLIAAKTAKAHEKLVTAFATREIKKSYLAICIGNPGNKTIDAPIGRHKIKRKQMAIMPAEGKEAITQIKTLGTEEILSVVQLYPKTGRTHQLRVHLKLANAPILGDKTYGNKALNQKFKIDRHLLHAYTLVFSHPLTQQTLEIKAPIPHDMSIFVKKILKQDYESFIAAGKTGPGSGL